MGGVVVVFLNDCNGGFQTYLILDAGMASTYAVAALRSAGRSLPGVVAGDTCGSGNIDLFPSLLPREGDRQMIAGALS